jgi:hypothetical protein
MTAFVRIIALKAEIKTARKTGRRQWAAEKVTRAAR